MIKDKLQQHHKAALSLSLGALLILIPANLIAQVMQGSAYRIQSDSINFGGGESSGTLYNINGTLGELGTGPSSGTAYKVNAGYWQVQEGTYVAISTPTDIDLGSISGLAGGSSEDTATWTVTTDSPSGYTLTIESTTTPALQSLTDSFDDYTPSGADPDFDFSIATSDSAFGFSPEGADINSRFKDNGSACNTGSSEASGKCWDGLSTTPQTIAGGASSNHPTGSGTDVRFRAESGSSNVQAPGTYTAEIVLTATAL